MKIAIPVNDKSMEMNVCVSLGRAPYFLIYDMESKESSFIDNGAASSHGGTGIKAAQIIVDHQVSALLTPQCGENAAEVINAANIKIYETINHSIKDNIKALQDGKLSLLEDLHSAKRCFRKCLGE